jgi:hypothetical protein
VVAVRRSAHAGGRVGGTGDEPELGQERGPFSQRPGGPRTRRPDGVVREDGLDLPARAPSRSAMVSTPTSARTTSAVRRLTPAIVPSRCTSVSNGTRGSSTRSLRAVRASSGSRRCARIGLTRNAGCRRHRPASACRRAGSSARSPLAQPGWRHRWSRAPARSPASVVRWAECRVPPPSTLDTRPGPSGARRASLTRCGTRGPTRRRAPRTPPR